MEKFSKADGSDGIQGPCRAGRKGWVVHDTLIEVVQIIEKDKSDVQPSQGQEEGEEEQAKPDTVALAGLRLLFRTFPPVAAIHAVEAAGPDGETAWRLGHSERLDCYSVRRLLVTGKTQGSGLDEVTGFKPGKEGPFLESFIAPYF